MKADENRAGENYNSLLDGIQGEVAAENAPLLNFITRYAGIIAGCAILLLLVLGGMGIWNWWSAKKDNELRMEISRILLQKNVDEQYGALAELAKDAPASVKFSIYMTMARIARSKGDSTLAAEAYANAANLDAEGALGLAAALGEVGSLMEQKKYDQALMRLKELEKRAPNVKNSLYLQQLMADAAVRTGDKQLAMEIFRKLADEVSRNGENGAASGQGAYYRQRSDQLTKELASGQDGAGKK